MMMRNFVILLVIAMAASLITSDAKAQISAPGSFSGGSIRVASLQEQLVNRLRATKTDQQNFLAFVIDQVEAGNLDIRFVLAIEKYAIRRNREFPFPFFERALRFQAARRGVTLPPVRLFAASGAPSSP